MQRTSYTILLIAIIGVATLGSLGVGLMDHAGSPLCPFSNAACPPTSNALFVALHHFSGLANLNEVNIGAIGLLSVLLLLLVVFIKTQRPIVQLVHLTQPQNSKIAEIPYIKQLLFWLTLHNKLEPHAVALVRSEP